MQSWSDAWHTCRHMHVCVHSHTQSEQQSHSLWKWWVTLPRAQMQRKCLRGFSFRLWDNSFFSLDVSQHCIHQFPPQWQQRHRGLQLSFGLGFHFSSQASWLVSLNLDCCINKGCKVFALYVQAYPSCNEMKMHSWLMYFIYIVLPFISHEVLSFQGDCQSCIYSVWWKRVLLFSRISHKKHQLQNTMMRIL